MSNLYAKLGHQAILLILLSFSAHLLAEPLTSETQWKDPSWVQLEIDFPGNGYHASWHLSRCDCGDLLIRSELNVPGEVTHGELLLVAQRVVLKRGFGPEQAEQISFEAPALMMQLALRLLERSEPAGPSAITEAREVDVKDEINYINLDTGVAEGGFPAPWRVEGKIWPQAESQRRFDLLFTFNAAGIDSAEAAESKMRIAGISEYAVTTFSPCGRHGPQGMGPVMA